MSKLTLDQIRFIDTYLKNSGVQYIDIRYEMTDHVATALEAMEGNFMENFKAYMLQNKQQLLFGNKKFKQLAARRAGWELLKTLCHFWVLPVLAVLVFATHYFFAATNVTDAALYMRMVFLVAYLVGFAKTYRKHKYSVTSKLYGVCGLVLYYIGMIVTPERFTTNLWVVFTVYSVIIVIGCALSVTALRIQKQYKLRYAA